MRVLTARNADVTIAGYSFVANINYNVDNRPQELDLPSGAWFVWPLRRGQLVIQRYVDPGTAPSTPKVGSVSPTPTSVSFTTKTPDSATPITIETTAAYHTGLTIQTTRLQEMPVLQETIQFTVLVDDAEESDY